MIPKIIHYCWLGGNPIPAKLQRYIDTWKKHMPDYKIMQWDEKMLDINSCKWVRQACDQKKYAFAADYIRFYALYNYGGIYLDTDVQVLKPYDPFLPLHTMVGYQDNTDLLEVSTFGIEKGMPWVKSVMDYYETHDFVYIEENMENILCQPLVTRVLRDHNYRMVNVNSLDEALRMKDDKQIIPVFPCDYFCPKGWTSQLIHTTDKTFSIHHYSGTWLPEETQKRRNMKDSIPQWLLRLIRMVKR